MKKENKRALRCFGAYLLFVLILLFSVCGLFFLFSFFSGNLPRFPSLSRPTAATESMVTVIIDAGHGGEDGGAVGTVNGQSIHEKDINLSISLMLRDLLEANGVNVVMTRTEDVLLYDRNTNFQGRKKVLDLAARLHVGQSIENAVFVSIHMNAFPQSQYKGLQVYYSPNHSASACLAQGIQERVAGQLQKDNHRGIKRADSSIYLLEHLRCPAVLVECGFLSNVEECAALADPKYQQKLAFSLFCSVCETLATSEDHASPPETDTALFVDTTKSSFVGKILSEPLIFDTKYSIIKKRAS